MKGTVDEVAKSDDSSKLGDIIKKNFDSAKTKVEKETSKGDPKKIGDMAKDAYNSVKGTAEGVVNDKGVRDFVGDAYEIG